MIGDLVAKLIAAGTQPELAASVVAEAFAAGVVSAEFRGQSTDKTAERRRAKDRDRKRLLRGIPQTSADIPRNSADTHTHLLTSLSTSLEHSEEKKVLKKVRARKPNSAPLSADWQPNAKHYEAAEKLKIPNAAVLEKAEDMRLWAQSNGELKADWDATFHGFLRRDATKLAAYPPQKPEGVMTDDERDRLFAKLREKPNGQENTRQGSELRAISDGARQDETPRPKESSDPSDDQSRNGGMGRLDPVFRRPSGVRAGGDEAGEVGDGPRIYSAGPIARVV